MNTLEQSAERFARLPSDFQEALRHFNYDERLRAIHQKFSLHIDQSFALEKTLGDIIFGDAHSDALQKTLEHALHTTKEQAEDIAIEINGSVLLPIREAIKAQQQKTREEMQGSDEDEA